MAKYRHFREVSAIVHHFRVTIEKQEEKSEFNEEVMIMSRNIKGGFLILGGCLLYTSDAADDSALV